MYYKKNGGLAVALRRKRIIKPILRHLHLRHKPRRGLGVASDTGAPLAKCAHDLDRGSQAVAQTASCGDAKLSQQEKKTPLTPFAHDLDRGAQAGAQAASCGDAKLPQQEKDTRQMSRREKAGCAFLP
jgi:hypothetical protein